jgi:hypothetical protein
VTATIFNDKQSRDLALHSAGLSKGLRACRNVWHVAEYFACRIHNHRPLDGDARGKRVAELGRIDEEPMRVPFWLPGLLPATFAKPRRGAT